MSNVNWGRDDDRKVYGSVVYWTVGLVALGLAVAAALWAFGVFTSDVRGQGDARKIKNSGINRIQQQAQFEQDKADFDGYLNKIVVANGNLEAAKESGDKGDIAQRRVEFNGLQQQCIDTAQGYNARSRTYTARDFRAADLPKTLDPSKCSEGP